MKNFDEEKATIHKKGFYIPLKLNLFAVEQSNYTFFH